VVSFAGVDRAFAVKDGKAAQRLLVLGQKSGDMVEIKGGIAAGDQVIADPNGLVHGSPVQVEGH
jgi:hypothetical protein